MSLRDGRVSKSYFRTCGMADVVAPSVENSIHHSEQRDVTTYKSKQLLMYTAADNNTKLGMLKVRWK